MERRRRKGSKFMIFLVVFQLKLYQIEAGTVLSESNQDATVAPVSSVEVSEEVDPPIQNPISPGNLISKVDPLVSEFRDLSGDELFVITTQESVRAMTSSPSKPESSTTAPSITKSPTSNLSTTISSTTISSTSKDKKSSDEKNRSKSDDPSMDEIISGIISLIGGNMKQLTSGHRGSANKPANFPSLPSISSLPSIPDEGDFYTANGIRINNRGPAFNDPTLGNHPNGLPLPPSVLIGPGTNYGLPLSQAHHRVIVSNENSGVGGGRPVSKPPPSQMHIHPVNIPESDITSLLGQRLNYNYNSYKDPSSIHRLIPGNGILPKYPSQEYHHKPNLETNIPSQEYHHKPNHHKPNLETNIQPLNLPPGHEGLSIQTGGLEYPPGYELPPGMQLPPSHQHHSHQNPSLNDHRTTTGVLVPASSHQYPHPDYVHINTNFKHQEPMKGDASNGIAGVNRNKDHLHNYNKGHPHFGGHIIGQSNNNGNMNTGTNNKKLSQQNINWYSSDPSPSSVSHMNGHNTHVPSHPTLVPSHPTLVPSSSNSVASSISSSVTKEVVHNHNPGKGERDPSISSVVPIQATKVIPSLSSSSLSSSPPSSGPQDLLEAAGSNQNVKQGVSDGKDDSGSVDETATDWLPVGGLKPTRTWTDAPPIIITQEEPSVFDITIKHKLGASIGTSVASDTSFKVTVPLPTNSFMSTTSPSLIGNLNAEDDLSLVPTISASTTAVPTLTDSSETKPAEEGTRIRPAEEGTRVRPAEEGTRIRPAEEGTRIRPAEEGTRATRIRPTRLSPTRVRTSGVATTFLPTAQLRLRPGSGSRVSVTPSQVVVSSDTSSTDPVGEGEVISPTKVSTPPEVTSTITGTGIQGEEVSKNDTSSAERNGSAINGTKEGSPKRDEVDIVYGKPVDSNRPTAPLLPDLSPSGDATSVPGNFVPGKVDRTTVISSATNYNQRPGSGRPVIVPVDMDEVKPNMAGGVRPSRTRNRAPAGEPAVLTDKGSVYIDGRPTHFKIRPAPSVPTMQVGSGVTVNVVNDRQGQGGHVEQPEYGQGSVGNVAHVLSPDGRPNRGPPKATSVRRQPFRPRPVVPLVRIDTCIVGDDTTCDVKMNERCRTELGISSCQCKPGYGRSTPRGMCSPIVTLSLSLRLDKLGDNRLVFNRNYLNPNSEEYQFLEYESIQGLNSLFSSSRLSKIFMGVKVNKFYSMGSKMMVNASVELENSNITRTSGVKRVLMQELSRVLTLKNHMIGDSTLSIEPSTSSSSTSGAITRVDDVNECNSPDLNDCSLNAVCMNDFGSFRCMCKKGYEDKYSNDPKKSGRHCASCSSAHCSNRGECHIVNGEKECKCRGNFIGSKCDIDIEVLGVAVGGSVAALVIIVMTFLCLYMWNQRWKVEQQKIEAMSAASAQTFSYVNKQQQLAAAYGHRYTIDDRYGRGWNEANFYTQQSPEHQQHQHILATANASQQHVYATPSRVQTPDALLSADDLFDHRSHHYTRPSRSKSRNSTLQQHHYPTGTLGAGSVFNETEFSTRETLYTPAHLVMTNPRKSSSYGLYS